MVDVVYILFTFVLIQLVSATGIAYFTYRIIQLIGYFLAWTLILIGIFALVFRAIWAIVLLLIVSPVQLASIIEGAGLWNVLSIQFVGTIGPIVLLVGMYGLMKVFERQLKKS